MGLHPDEIGRFYFPDFNRYITYYSDPKKFLDAKNSVDAVKRSAELREKNRRFQQRMKRKS